MKFREIKFKVMYLGRNNPMHEPRLWRANGRKGALERRAGGSWWIRS